MNQSEISWIHFSDLHIAEEDQFNRKRVLDALWSDLDAFLQEGFTPDFIAFTGDVSHSAQKNEYALAVADFFDPLLAKTSIPESHLYIVPGNHDANWNITSRLQNPLASLKSTDDIRELVEDSETRELILSPFANYRSFIKSYLGSDGFDPAFSTSRAIDKGGVRSLVVGLNSAWLSGFNKDTEGKVSDLGKLALSEVQVVEAQRAVDSSQIVICLLHHPFEWLMEIDRNVVEHRLRKFCHVILRGHLHRPNVLAESTLAGEVVVIPAGAVFESRQSPNDNLVRLNTATGEGEVFLRRYNDERSEWVKDIYSTGEKSDGRVSFRLRGVWMKLLYDAGEPTPSRHVWDYKCVFTNECKRDMAELGLEERSVINLVESEFVNHINYFLFDLEDYPLPVRSSYIVYLDKVNDRIEFRKIIPCSKNEAKLASWNDILALYRRASRLAYRQKPETILFVRGLLGRTIELHDEIRGRIQKHFEKLEGLPVIGAVIPDTLEAHKVDRSSGIRYHLGESERAERETHQISLAMNRRDIGERDALALIVSELERSLQHIHKVLLLFPPIDEIAKSMI